MKRIAIIVSCMMFALSLAGVASAIPYQWSETIDWDPDQKLNRSNDWFSYYHDLRTDGFDSELDRVYSYGLSIRLYDDWDRRAERALIWQPGIPFFGDPDTVTRYNFSFEDIEIGWTLLGLIDINDDGTLNLGIQRTRGDFYVDWSKINAWGFKGSDPDPVAPVPEPATMLLLGAGLAGMAAVRRRKSRKA